MRRFTYTGSLTSLSLPHPEDPEGKPLFEGMLHHGKSYRLPEDHETVKVWVARGLLVEGAKEPEPDAPPPPPPPAHAPRATTPPGAGEVGTQRSASRQPTADELVGEGAGGSKPSRRKPAA